MNCSAAGAFEHRKPPVQLQMNRERHSGLKLYDQYTKIHSEPTKGGFAPTFLHKQ